MTERFEKATRATPSWSNADDPDADRLARYPDAGELGGPEGVSERVGAETGPGTTPSSSDPAGPDAEIIGTGATGDRLGGWHATDTPGEPGLPGHDQPVEGGREADEDRGTGGPFVDRLGS